MYIKITASEDTSDREAQLRLKLSEVVDLVKDAAPRAMKGWHGEYQPEKGIYPEDSFLACIIELDEKLATPSKVLDAVSKIGDSLYCYTEDGMLVVDFDIH